MVMVSSVFSCQLLVDSGQLSVVSFELLVTNHPWSAVFTAKRLRPRAQGCCFGLPWEANQLIFNPNGGCVEHVIIIRLIGQHGCIRCTNPQGGPKRQGFWGATPLGLELYLTLFPRVAQSGNPGLWAVTASR